jgi:hypothetical protein
LTREAGQKFFLTKWLFKKMTVKEIIEIENTNTGNMNLFKEGIFWRAYSPC